jgi:uncharacterized membrane protein
MSAVFTKRVLIWSIPTALLFMALQYHIAGRISADTVVVTLVVFLLSGAAREALDMWWKRRFEKRALLFAAVFWTCVAIVLFVLFYRMR